MYTVFIPVEKNELILPHFAVDFPWIMSGAFGEWPSRPTAQLSLGLAFPYCPLTFPFF